MTLKNTSGASRTDHKQKTNIPVAEFLRIYRVTEDAVPGVVIFGGRAINAYALESERATPDINFTLLNKPTLEQLNSLKPSEKIAEESNMRFELDIVGQRIPKVHVHSDIIDVAVGVNGVRLNFYFPGWNLPFSYRDSHRESGETRKTVIDGDKISGIPITEIVKSAREVMIHETPIAVVDPMLLVVMKAVAWNSRGNLDKNATDAVDINTMVRNKFDTKESFGTLVEYVGATLEKFGVEDRKSVFASFLENVDYKNINPALQVIAGRQLKELKRARRS